MHPVIYYFFIIIALLLLGTGVAFDYFRDFFGIVFAAFFGAHTSYILSDKKDRKKENEEKARKINSAIFSLWDSRESLSSFYKNSLEFHEGNLFRHLKIESYVGLERVCVKYDFMLLSFLLSLDEDGVVFKAKAVSDNAMSIYLLIDKRSDEFFHDAQKSISYYNSGSEFGLPYAALDSLLGASSKSLKGTTDAMYECIPGQIKAMDKVIGELYFLAIKCVDKKLVKNPSDLSRG